MSPKTKSQLERELQEAHARIARLERALEGAESGYKKELSSAQFGTASTSQAEEKLRALLEALPVGISVLNDERKIVFQNSALSRILDTTAEGLLTGAYKSRRYLSADGSAMPPEELASARTIESGQPTYDLETGIVKEEGGTVWTSVSAIPTHFPDWKTVLVTVDITDRKLLEQNLRESEKRYALLFEKLTVPAILLKLPEVVIVDVNESCEKLTGFTREEMLGKTAVQLGILKPKQREETISQFERERVLAGKEIHAYTKSGEECVVLSNTNPLMIGGQPYAITTLQDITERKRAEEKLAESESRFATIFENSPVAIGISRLRDGKITDANAAFLKLYALTRDEVIGRTTAELEIWAIPEDRQRFIEQVQAGTSVHNLESVARLKSGDERHVLVSGEKVEVNGQFYLVAQIQDVSERKRAEDALRQSQENFVRAFESNPAALAITRRSDGKFIIVNDSYTQIMGYDKTEIIGRTVTEFSIYVNPQERGELLQRLAEQGRVVNYELTVRAKKGEHRHLLVSMEPVTYDQEDSILSTFIDITERRRMEDKLRTSEERLRLSLHAANQGLYDLNVQTGETIVNDEYALMLGYDPADFHETNSFWIERLHPDDQQITAQAYKDYVEGRLPDYRVEFRQRTRSGEWKWILSLGKLVQWDEQGQPLRMLGTHTDINARKLMENELRRSNAELEQFAYIASHDLQEPLRAVAGMVQLLQKRYQGQLDERADEYIGHAVEAAGRMQALIQALLTYSRVERRNQPIEAVEAGHCLQAALKNLAVSIRESQAVITADELPTVHADPVQLTQLFQNLIGNGIKFRGEKEPLIHISATKLKDAWQFSVRDNGIGIESQYFERIFLIFQRLHTRREYSGTGIGLALCKKIVERHGGHIWVESDPGKGSTFHFTLPLRNQS